MGLNRTDWAGPNDETEQTDRQTGHRKRVKQDGRLTEPDGANETGQNMGQDGVDGTRQEIVPSV